jgi:hypothetical protein
MAKVEQNSHNLDQKPVPSGPAVSVIDYPVSLIRRLTIIRAHPVQHMRLVPLEIPYSGAKHHTQPDNRGESGLERGAMRPRVPERVLVRLFPAARRV